MEVRGEGEEVVQQMKKQLFVSGIAVAVYIFLTASFASFRIPVTYTYTARSGQDFPVGEEVSAVVTRSLWSFLNVEYGIETWMVHALFFSILISSNLAWWILQSQNDGKGSPYLVGEESQ